MQWFITEEVSTVMQSSMNEKNRAALLDPGARKVLSDLANVPSHRDRNWVIEAQKFISRYGPLRRAQDPAVEVLEYARRFREIWTAKTEEEYQVANGFLEEVFVAPDPFSAMRPIADFAAGKWQPRPRTLLDRLAIELMRSRKMLHRCERPECQRYFIKEFSRDKYCSIPCSDEMRTRGQRQWALNHRDEVNARRRKPRKKSRRSA
jgi:hypothetical protein